MEIKTFADNLYIKDGIWFSKNNREISYPKEGNLNCFEIEKNSYWFEHRSNCILEAVKHYSLNEVFFDIGGGNGYVAKRLEENHIQTVLIEPGIAGALNAKERGLKNIICSTFEEAGIKSNSCMAIGLFDVVEHIKDDKPFLKSINAILSDKGFVYITVPAFNLLWSKEDDYAGHFRRYSLKQLRSTLNESGFEVEYATYIFSILPFPILLFRTIPGLLGIHSNPGDLQKQKKDHSIKNPLVSSVLNKIWEYEISCIRRKKKIPVGGSCFVVARKQSYR